MEIFLKWLVIASVNLAATMSPGPAFVITVRNSMVYDRRTGIFTALGLGAGVGAHVILVLGGISIIIAKSVYLYAAIKYAGAAYLVYIGIKSLRSRKREQVSADSTEATVIKSKEEISAFKAFKIGFFANLLNPKAVIFFTAVYTQFIDLYTPFSVHVLYGTTSVAIEFLWFSGVTVVLTNPVIKQKFMGIVHWIERGCGGLMIALGVKLALSK